MNYRHLYHAGNFADVFKHLILILLLESFYSKETAFCFLDTHAGTGIYDLFSVEAQKTKEYENGIGQLRAAISKMSVTDIPAVVKTYLSFFKDDFHYYPGSPLIARYCLREQDKMILSELHPEEVQLLRKLFADDKQVAVHHLDAYLAMKAFLPPKERRGLVLIDPPYEKLEEMNNLLAALKKTLKHWQQGIYAIWYPLKMKYDIHFWREQLREIAADKILFAELSILPENTPDSFNGSGLAIINPPWKLDEKIRILLPWLWAILSVQGLGNYRLFSSGS